MTSATSTARSPAPTAQETGRQSIFDRLSTTALNSALWLWGMVTVMGQLIFMIYVFALYGGAAVHGNFMGWNKVMPRAYFAGETTGNIAIGTHLLVAALIMLAGTLQLIPQLRTRAPSFHRWNGRVYLSGAVAASISGLYMVWGRGTVGDVVQHIGTSINAVLILVFAGLALQHAIARDFSAHRRWALRLFLAVSGVWFFRVALMFWVALNHGPVGFDPTTFRGPFLSFLAFAQYVVPLTVLELYLRCRERGGTAARFGMALTLLALTIATGVGVAVATVGMWLPNI